MRASKNVAGFVSVVFGLTPMTGLAQGFSGTAPACVLQGQPPRVKVCFEFAAQGDVEVRFWHQPEGGVGAAYKMKMEPARGKNCYSQVVPPPSTSDGVAHYTFLLRQRGQALHASQSISPKVVTSEAACNGEKVAKTGKAPRCGEGLDCNPVDLEAASGIQHINPASQAPLGQTPPAPSTPAANPDPKASPTAGGGATPPATANQGGGGGAMNALLLLGGLTAAGIAVAGVAANAAGGGGSRCSAGFVSCESPAGGVKGICCPAAAPYYCVTDNGCRNTTFGYSCPGGKYFCTADYN